METKMDSPFRNIARILDSAARLVRILDAPEAFGAPDDKVLNIARDSFCSSDRTPALPTLLKAFNAAAKPRGTHVGMLRSMNQTERHALKLALRGDAMDLIYQAIHNGATIPQLLVGVASTAEARAVLAGRIEAAEAQLVLLRAAEHAMDVVDEDLAAARAANEVEWA